jgi:hypothetical protein
VPLTFPSHAAAVLPLKLWRRRWFDGVALVIGSAAPDLPYSLDPYLNVRAHTWWGLAWFCVPVTVLISALIRRAAPVVVAHLPVRRWPALRDYAAVGAHRHRWWITVTSAWLGACSHRLWDMVTHPSIDRGAISIDWLSTGAFAGQPWWRVLHYGSTVLGALAVLAFVVHIGRTGWLRAGGPPPVLPTARPVVFWAAVAVVLVPGVVVQPFLDWFTQPQAIIVRLLEIGGLALIVGAAAARRRRSRSRERRGSGGATGGSARSRNAAVPEREQATPA